jgi:hypothetical protein
MLTVGKVGPANVGYYQSAVVAGVEDYYADRLPRGCPAWSRSSARRLHNG